MRALFIGSYPNSADPHRSVFFRELIYQFARLGVECTVISPLSVTKYRRRYRQIPTMVCEQLYSGEAVTVYRPRMISYSAKKIGRWNTIHLTQRSIDHAVLRQVKKLEGKFDFVYGHFFLGGGLTAARVGRMLGIPAYIAYGECSFDTEVRNKYGDIHPKQMEGVHGIISVSSANSNDLAGREFARGIPVCLALNAVDANVFCIKDKKDCREKFGFSMDDFIIGFVGGFIERKGPNRVLEACRGLEGVKLAFAGKGEQRPFGDQVIFCESLVHEDVADFLNAVDVFVLPTLHEGCCNAVIEAMSCGKAIVSSDLPFNHDVLNSKNAILVDPNDIGQIWEAIRTLRDDVQLRRRLGEQALKDSQSLTIDQRARNILEFIQQTS